MHNRTFDNCTTILYTRIDGERVPCHQVGYALANYICAGFSLCASPLLEMRSRAMTSEPDISVFRPDRPGIRKVLGDLEAEIMELVWSRPADQGTTVRDIFEILYERRLRNERRRIAYTTAMNTMARLAKKNL